MPGYTLQRLHEMGIRTTQDYTWCGYCQRWWKKKGYPRHRVWELGSRGFRPASRKR